MTHPLESHNPKRFATVPARIKLEETLIAQFALAGHVVHKGPCGDFSVIRWGLARYCQNLEALQAFAKQVGA